MATTYLRRTPASDGNLTTMTFSLWLKRSKIVAQQKLVSTNYVGDALFLIDFNATDQLRIVGYSAAGATLHINKITNRVFRDTSAWYHLVIALDSTNSTAEDRCKIFINGERETSFATNSNPPLNRTFIWNKSSHVNDIGHYAYTGGDHFDGLMSHFHFIDGTAYDATAFGGYDANGVWKLKPSPSVTYGTNGFFILKDGNSVTDQSGNGNNYTVGGGTLTNTEDSPSNVFAVGNRLIPSLTTYTNGNLTVSNGASWKSSGSTIAVTEGKWYAEMKVDSGISTMFGVEDMDLINIWSPSYVGTSVNGKGYYSTGTVYSNSSTSAFGDSYTTGDIIGCALDMDNKFVYFSKNGVFQNSGDPTSGATGTGGLTLAGTTYCIGFSVYNTTVSLNFGNGYFGTTAVASAGTNASGNGIFEYDVPTGYTALSTTGLNL